MKKVNNFFKIKMVDSNPEIKTQPQTLEISGYWNPNEDGKPKRRLFFDSENNRRIEILSMGVLGTPEIRDPKTGRIIQNFYHITKSGQVVRVKWEGSDRLDNCSVDIIGLNGRIKTPENPDPTEPNKAKLIYEPRVVIE